MATAEEDFSFPATNTDSPPQFIESPPLWQHSPSPISHRRKPENLKGKEVEDAYKSNSWSFQEFKASSSIKRKSSSCDEDEEEKMDMLWENLNDEFPKSCGKMGAQNSDTSSPGKEVRVSCAKALKLSKANGQMLSGKKLSILVFIKVLKKLFLMHSSHHTIKNHT